MTIGPAAPSYVTTTHGNPAFAAYAAVAAPALPEELDAMTCAPSFTAIETDADASRSLNDQVGLRLSSLIRSRPRPSFGTGNKGVPPSPSVIASAASTGSQASKRHIDAFVAGDEGRGHGTVTSYATVRFAATPAPAQTGQPRA